MKNNDFDSAIFYSARKNAARRGIPFELTFEQFEALAKKQGGRCAVTGIKFSWGCTDYGNRRPFASSLDRIDSKGCYEKGNVRIVCIAANIAMNTWGEKVLIKMAKAICGDASEREGVKEKAAEPHPEEIKPIERYIDRNGASEYLTSLGLRVAKTTLQKWVTTGGGPAYRRFGKRAVYLPSDLDAWASNKLTEIRTSSSGASCELSRI